MTLHRAESGETAVALGTYVRILAVLHLAADLNLIAEDDVLGRRLQDIALPQKRIRSAAKKAAKSPAKNTEGALDEQQGS